MINVRTILWVVNRVGKLTEFFYNDRQTLFRVRWDSPRKSALAFRAVGPPGNGVHGRVQYISKEKKKIGKKDVKLSQKLTRQKEFVWSRSIHYNIRTKIK